MIRKLCLSIYDLNLVWVTMFRGGANSKNYKDYPYSFSQPGFYRILCLEACTMHRPN